MYHTLTRNLAPLCVGSLNQTFSPFHPICWHLAKGSTHRHSFDKLSTNIKPSINYIYGRHSLARTMTTRTSHVLIALTSLFRLIQHLDETHTNTRVNPAPSAPTFWTSVPQLIQLFRFHSNNQPRSCSASIATWHLPVICQSPSGRVLLFVPVC